MGPEKNWNLGHLRGGTAFRLLECLEWLAIYILPGDNLQLIRLTEGDHHYFDSCHLFNSQGAELGRKTLPGAEVVEFLVSDLLGWGHTESAQGGNPAGARVLLVRAWFLPYRKHPLSRSDERLEVSCGTLFDQRTETNEPVYVHISARAAARIVTAPRSALEAFREFTRLTAEVPPVRLRADTPGIVLEHYLPYPTRVYLFTDEILPDGITPGARVALDTIPNRIPPLEIDAGSLTPRASPPYPEWRVALPVLLTTQGGGVVGAAKAGSDLIGACKDDRSGPWITLSWRWLGPDGLKARIFKWVEDGSGRRPQLEDHDVFHQTGSRNVSYRIHECPRGSAGHILHVRLLPILRETEIWEQKKDLIIRL